MQKLNGRVLWVAAAVVALALVAVVLMNRSDEATVAADSPTPSASPSPSGSASEPTPSASGTSDAEPAPAPTPTPTTVVNGVVLPDREVVPPVPLDKPAVIVPDFTAKVTSIKAIDGVGQGIGEISGPALMFTITLTNNTKAPLETVGVVVNAYDSTAAPAIPLYGDPNAKSLPDAVAPGQTVTGVYVFRVDPQNRNVVTLTLAFDPEKPTVVFTGPISS